MMNKKRLPFSRAQIEAILSEHPTPFYLYDEGGLRRQARLLNRAFGWAEGFQEFFAVKATPTPAILQLLQEEGFGADCSSLAELLLAEAAGLVGEQIMFTSNNTPAAVYEKAQTVGAIVNLDDIGHIDYLAQQVGLPDLLSFRYNPGPLRTGNEIIGNPVESKFGVTREQLFEGYARARELGVRRFGLHSMVVSNELDDRRLVQTARMLFELAAEIMQRLAIRIEFVNIGGGIGIPYRPEEKPVDLEHLAAGIRHAYSATIESAGLGPVSLFMECGRLITGPHGYLVTGVRHLKQSYKRYAGLDASMADLMRPGMYGAYHHVTVLGKEEVPHTDRYDLTGSLCENNDKFAIDRPLPPLEPGDLLVIHDAGAHGRAMGFNYNGQLRPAELLLMESGETKLIRRRESLADYFATLRFPGSSFSF